MSSQYAAQAAAALAASTKQAKVPAPSPAAQTSLDERAQKSGVDRNVKEAEDNGDPERVFQFKIKPYIEPKDIDSVDETRQVDEENTRRYEFNMTQLPTLSIVFKRAGVANFKLAKPPNYHDRAKQLYMSRINEPAFKTLEAVRFLLKRQKVLGRDFTLDDAISKADDVVSQEFLEAQKKKVNNRIDIRNADGVPSNHHNVCNCQYIWDGVSQYCAGTSNPSKRLRMTWRMPKESHFLVPIFEPFSF